MKSCGGSNEWLNNSLFRAGLFDRTLPAKGATIPECHRTGQHRRRLQLTSAVELSQEYLKSILSYDAETGVFIWLIDRKPFKAGRIAGWKTDNGYIRISVLNKHYLAHRLAWLYVYGNFPNGEIDHKNMARDDNRIINLRDVNHSINMHNKKKHPNNTSGFTGVCWSKKRRLYRARIGINGKIITLGFFNDACKASEAYNKAKENFCSFK